MVGALVGRGLVMLAAGALWVTAAAADVYYYRDERGVLCFTNVPTGPGYRRLSLKGAKRWRGLGRHRYDALIIAVARHYGVQPELVKAVIKAESDFEPWAVSPKGALGLMQLMPETAALHRVRNAFSPAENVEGGVRHLRDLLERYGGDTVRALAAYNAGTAAVDQAGGVPPIPETRGYVRRVLRYWRQYLSGRTGARFAARRPD